MSLLFLFDLTSYLKSGMSFSEHVVSQFLILNVIYV